MSRFSQEFFNEGRSLADSRDNFAVVTWLKSEGHAPQTMGAKAIITDAGLHWGTVGGGKVEAKAIELGLELLRKQHINQPEPRLLRWDLQSDVGMSCGGSVHLLFEVFLAKSWSVVIFGAGHVSQALVRALGLLDCYVTCIDSRPEWLAKMPQENNSYLKLVEAPDMTLYAEDVPPGSYCVLLTKGHASDLPILMKLAKRRDLVFLGVIGSRVKARKLRAELGREGFSLEEINSFQCPVGIGFTSHQPSEIAVSIVAQLLLIKNGSPRLT